MNPGFLQSVNFPVIAGGVVWIQAAFGRDSEHSLLWQGAADATQVLRFLRLSSAMWLLLAVTEAPEEAPSHCKIPPRCCDVRVCQSVCVRRGIWEVMCLVGAFTVWCVCMFVCVCQSICVSSPNNLLCVFMGWPLPLTPKGRTCNTICALCVWVCVWEAHLSDGTPRVSSLKHSGLIQSHSWPFSFSVCNTMLMVPFKWMHTYACWKCKSLSTTCCGRHLQLLKLWHYTL